MAKDSVTIGLSVSEPSAPPGRKINSVSLAKIDLRIGINIPACLCPTHVITGSLCSYSLLNKFSLISYYETESEDHIQVDEIQPFTAGGIGHGEQNDRGSGFGILSGFIFGSSCLYTPRFGSNLGARDGPIVTKIHLQEMSRICSSSANVSHVRWDEMWTRQLEKPFNADVLELAVISPRWYSLVW